MQNGLAQFDATALPPGEHWLLLLDTCGETAGVALARVVRSQLQDAGGADAAGASVTSTIEQARELAGRQSSVEIVGAVREMLAVAQCSVASLGCVGVVSGPGSFTGVRVGLSVAKGLCEATEAQLALVSRLAVLAEAAAPASSQPVLALLDAGRGAVYVRDAATGRESLQPLDTLAPQMEAHAVVTAEPRLADKLQATGMIATPHLHRLHVQNALGLVVARWLAGGDDVAHAEPNYVRSEQEIYAKTSPTAAVTCT